MCKMIGTWRCVCEQDTAHILVMLVANRILELAICNLHLLPRAVPAGMGILELQPTQRGGVEVGVADKQCAWYVHTHTWRCVCVSKIRHIST